jgi:hypothetical protein
MRFTRQRCAAAGRITVRPVCGGLTPPITTPSSSLIQTDTASRRIAAQAKLDRRDLRERTSPVGQESLFEAGSVKSPVSVWNADSHE